MKVRYKIYALAAFALIAMLVMGLLGLNISRNDDAAMDEAITMSNHSVDVLNLSIDTSDLARFNWRLAAAAQLPRAQQLSELMAIEKVFSETLTDAQKRVANLRQTTFATPKNKEIWQQINALWGGWIAVDLRIQTLLQQAIAQGTPEACNALFAETLKSNVERNATSVKLDDLMDGMAAETVQTIAAAGEDGKAVTRQFIVILSSAAVVAILLLAFIVWSLQTSVIHPIEKVRDLVVAIGR
ncbi:MAG: hypothetical protein LBL69_04700, partial [Zoogloeaceae bacterium]|nr:hypothetical protein [Zoogloeaceae bacterium]